MRSPYYQQQLKIQQKEKDKEEADELEQMTKDAFKDPMQDMIDKYADMAEKTQQAQSANITSDKNVTTVSKVTAAQNNTSPNSTSNANLSKKSESVNKAVSTVVKQVAKPNSPPKEPAQSLTQKHFVASETKPVQKEPSEDEIVSQVQKTIDEKK